MNNSITYEEFLESLKSFKPSVNDCRVSNSLVMLQGKWTNHVLFELCKQDSIRFGELKRALPEITNTMLTTTLRELESYDLVNRIQYNEIPPHVEYSLTKKGRDLIPIFYEIYKWTLKYGK
ncbi:MAG: helix-turn-helix transcriptional regulator [Hungatella sp.]|nr:helix-turn-helix transcriptional regulator [Paenibacillaceae bacterium]MTK10033.1 helix-turn-helix transcriptional regulator [Hungatella sp.]